MELISDEEYESLPDEPQQKFLRLEQICRTNLHGLITTESHPARDESLKREYMTIVSVAASELSIGDLDAPRWSEDWSEAYETFRLEVGAIITRLQLRSSGPKAFSVHLTSRTKARIELQINRLRTIIEDSDLPAHRKQSLMDKLDELSQELVKPRVRFANIMAILAVVSVGVATTTSFLADAPDALATITSLIGQDKEAEEAERLRLGHERTPALPAPETPAEHSRGRGASAPSFESSGMDDDIPF